MLFLMALLLNALKFRDSLEIFGSSSGAFHFDEALQAKAETFHATNFDLNRVWK